MRLSPWTVAALLAGSAGAPPLMAAGTLPNTITYAGKKTSVTSIFATDEVIRLTNNSGTLSGSIQNQFGTIPVTGTYSGGQCTLTVNKQTYVGACDAQSFQGSTFEKKNKEISRFAMAAIQEDHRQTADAGRAQRAPGPIYVKPPERFANMSVPRIEVPTGNFDYFEGDPLPPDDDSRDGRRGDDGGSYGGGGAGLPAPPGTVWAYGRYRWVIQPGGRCDRAGELVRGYCFGAVIAYLRQHPKEKNVTAITLSYPTPLGTWVSTDTPIRYGYVEVSRQGDGFKGDKHLTGTSKVRIPPGCHYSPLKEGFVLVAPGPRGLQEAALFQCP